MTQTTLTPTLWRSCRALANPVRQRILSTLFKDAPLTVSAVAVACGIADTSATQHLRALQSRGLLSVERSGRFAFYRPEPDMSIPHGKVLLQGMRTAIRRGDSVEDRIRALTAFTHARRIVVVQALAGSAKDTETLVRKCHISRPALHRHLLKLQKRGLISRCGHGTYALARNVTGLPLVLRDLALQT